MTRPATDPARLLSLFDEFADLDAASLAVRLAALAEEDPATANAVTRMLAADQREHGLIDRGLGRLAADCALPTAWSAARPGDVVDGFVLECELGHGGMGEVWRATRQTEGFEQVVALKMLKGAGPELVRRFVQERRILAGLSHPAIARFVDGGVTGAGLPWYAMELIDGLPIDAHARTRGLGLRARVALVAEVAEAVAYAHTRLVVHRDLKPSNILVDGAGRPHLLDFGIAKLLDTSADDARTSTGWRALSPAYASPEQVLGEAVSTATDVYALGILLYELLTGALPHQRAGASLETLAEAVRSESPERPSQVLRRGARAGADAAGRTRWSREAAGDLDTIVLTALQREPERRYAGAAQFAEDLRRWLDGRPITAQADSKRYRIGKFVRRNRLVVGSAVAVALALLTGFGAALWQADVARGQAARAVAEAQRAGAEAERASRVRDFVLALFREQDPLLREQARARSGSELIASGIAQASTELASEPELRAAIVLDLAKIQFNLGELKSARGHFEALLAEHAARDGTDSIGHAEALAWLGATQLALGEREAAARNVPEAAARLEQLLGKDDRRTADARVALVRLRLEQGKNAESLALAREVHASFVTLKGADHPDTLRRLFNVGVALNALDRLAEAEATFRRVIAGFEASANEAHAQLIYPYTMLGDVLRRRGELAAAADAYTTALRLGRDVLGDAHTAVGHTMMRLGDLQRRLGRADEAHRSLDFAERVFAPLGSPELGQVEVFRALLLRQQDRLDAALAAYRRAEAHYAKVLGADNFYTIAARLSAAGVQAELGEHAAALEAGRPAAEAMRALAPEGYEGAFAWTSLGDIEAAAGDHVRALESYRAGLAILLGTFGADAPQVASAEINIAEQLVKTGGELPEARRLVDRAIGILGQQDPGTPTLAEGYLVSARIARAAGDPERARIDHAEGLRRLIVLQGEDSRGVRAARAEAEAR